LLNNAIEKTKTELCEYAFNRIKHPKLDLITEDSLRKCLNDYDIVIGGDGNRSDQVIELMIKMANELKDKNKRESDSEKGSDDEDMLD
jgi:hypothetical protein